MVACIAVINAGSSSIKLSVYTAEAEPALLAKGVLEGIGTSPRARICGRDGIVLARQEPGPVDHDAATHVLVRMATDALGRPDLLAVGHRVVHGGPHHAMPERVTDRLLEELESLVPLAPLHQPHNLAPIAAIRARRPELPQVACFDTAFHRGQEREAQAFALPREITSHGVHRYGFHGLSYAFITRRLRTLAPDLAAGRVIVAHLGNGASLCAIRDGRSIASTMGFTAVDGLMMGTRCGALDPGVLIYLMDQHGYDARALEDLIYRKSGLLGVSGISSDMRALRQSRDDAAIEAISLFVYRIVREIGSLVAALGDLDGLVFTAGIGENDAATRAEVVDGCAWLGAEIDGAKNAKGSTDIATSGSRVRIMVVPTDEELEIAIATVRLLGK